MSATDGRLGVACVRDGAATTNRVDGIYPRTAGEAARRDFPRCVGSWSSVRRHEYAQWVGCALQTTPAAQAALRRDAEALRAERRRDEPIAAD